MENFICTVYISKKEVSFFLYFFCDHSFLFRFFYSYNTPVCIDEKSACFASPSENTSARPMFEISINIRKIENRLLLARCRAFYPTARILPLENLVSFVIVIIHDSAPPPAQTKSRSKTRSSFEERALRGETTYPTRFALNCERSSQPEVEVRLEITSFLKGISHFKIEKMRLRGKSREIEIFAFQ